MYNDQLSPQSKRYPNLSNQSLTRQDHLFSHKLQPKNLTTFECLPSKDSNQCGEFTSTVKKQTSINQCGTEAPLRCLGQLNRLGEMEAKQNLKRAVNKQIVDSQRIVEPGMPIILHTSEKQLSYLSNQTVRGIMKKQSFARFKEGRGSIQVQLFQGEDNQSVRLIVTNNDINAEAEATVTNHSFSQQGDTSKKDLLDLFTNLLTKSISEGKQPLSKMFEIKQGCIVVTFASSVDNKLIYKLPASIKIKENDCETFCQGQRQIIEAQQHGWSLLEKRVDQTLCRIQQRLQRNYQEEIIKLGSMGRRIEVEMKQEFSNQLNLLTKQFKEQSSAQLKLCSQTLLSSEEEYISSIDQLRQQLADLEHSVESLSQDFDGLKFQIILNDRNHQQKSLELKEQQITNQKVLTMQLQFINEKIQLLQSQLRHHVRQIKIAPDYKSSFQAKEQTVQYSQAKQFSEQESEIESYEGHYHYCQKKGFEQLNCRQSQTKQDSICKKFKRSSQSVNTISVKK